MFAALVSIAIAAIVWAGLPHPALTIGTRFDGRPGAAATFRSVDRFRALLDLDRPLGSTGYVTMTLYQRSDGGDHQLKEIPIHVLATQDHVIFAAPVVTGFVGSVRGEFRLVFRYREKELGSGRFAVAD